MMNIVNTDGSLLTQFAHPAAENEDTAEMNQYIKITDYNRLEKEIFLLKSEIEYCLDEKNSELQKLRSDNSELNATINSSKRRNDYLMQKFLASELTNKYLGEKLKKMNNKNTSNAEQSTSHKQVQVEVDHKQNSTQADMTISTESLVKQPKQQQQQQSSSKGNQKNSSNKFTDEFPEYEFVSDFEFVEDVNVDDNNDDGDESDDSDYRPRGHNKLGLVHNSRDSYGNESEAPFAKEKNNLKLEIAQLKNRCKSGAEQHAQEVRKLKQELNYFRSKLHELELKKSAQAGISEQKIFSNSKQKQNTRMKRQVDKFKNYQKSRKLMEANFIWVAFRRLIECFMKEQYNYVEPCDNEEASEIKTIIIGTHGDIVLNTETVLSILLENKRINCSLLAESDDLANDLVLLKQFNDYLRKKGLYREEVDDFYTIFEQYIRQDASGLNLDILPPMTDFDNFHETYEEKLKDLNYYALQAKLLNLAFRQIKQSI